jgi:hypothetical protein
MKFCFVILHYKTDEDLSRILSIGDIPDFM